MAYTLRDRFVEKAQAAGAVYLLAPETSEDPLTNLGSLAGISPAELMNGAALTDSGLLPGAAAASLDGENDYIDTGWETRTNLIYDPYFASDGSAWSTWFYKAGTLEITEEKSFLGDQAAKLTLPEAYGVSGLRVKKGITWKSGETKTIAAWVWLPNAGNYRLGVRNNASTWTPHDDYSARSGGEWVKLGPFTAENTLGEDLEENQWNVVVQREGTFNEGDEIFFGAVIVEEGEVAEQDYFPTPEQLESGLAGWAGAEHESESDIGPFARGTARTWVALLQRDSTETLDTILGGAGGVVRLQAAAGSSNVTATFDGGENTATWEAALPGEEAAFVALVLEGDEATLYVNGESKGTEEVTRAAASGSLLLGVHGETEAPFVGLLLPFAVFTKALSAAQIEELYRQAIGTFSRPLVTREYPPDLLAVRVDPPDAGPGRWAEDEAKAENVATGISFSSEMQGGYKEAGCSLARDPRRDWPDLAPYSDLYIHGPGAGKVWEGRLDKAPESDGEQMRIDPAAVGWNAALEDRKALRLGIIDPDLSKWGDPSTERRLQLLEASIKLVASTSVGFSSKDPEATAAAVIDDFLGAEKSTTATEAGEAHYDSGGPDLGQLLYDFRELTSVGENASWENTMAMGATDTFSTFEEGSDHNAATATQQSVTAPSAGYRFARLRDRWTGGGTTGEQLIRVFAWQNLRVLSRLATQNLALQGEWPAVGYTAAQMLRLLLPEYSPLSATEESVEDDGFVIPQAWWADPTTLLEIVEELTRYGLYDWFVYEDKLFQLREPGSYGRRWQAYAGPSDLKEAGIDGSRLWEEIVVAYKDVDGITRYVGPPGSGADTESEGLRVTDPDHPAVVAEVTREDILGIDVATSSSAIAIGERWLEDANDLARSGEATLRGYILDDRSVMRPVSQIRAGDEIRFPDAGSTGRGYRKITRASYDHDNRTCQVTLDAPSESVQALLERYKAVLISRGIRL